MKGKLLIAGTALALISSCNTMENPLLTESTAPFGAPQFDKIRNEHYLPAFEAGIAEAKAEIDAIVPVRHLTVCQVSSSTSWRQIQTTRCSR